MEKRIGKSQRLQRTLHWVTIGLIMLGSFFMYSSLFYPELNSDDALNILMTHYYELPQDWYCWGQDRGGTLVPFISQLFSAGLGWNAVLSVSLSNYLLLVLGFLGFSSLFKNRFIQVLLALVWFFPPIPFLELTRFPLGVQYSLIGIAIYLIQKLDFKAKSLLKNQLYLLGVLLVFAAAIWASDLAAVTILTLLFALGISNYITTRKVSVHPSVLAFFLSGSVIIYTFINYAKGYATVYYQDFSRFVNWEEFTSGLTKLFTNLSDVYSFEDGILIGLFAWLAPLALGATVLAIRKSSVQWTPKTRSYSLFFLLDFGAILLVIFLSKWVFLNGMGRWYFIPTYLSAAMVVLFLADQCSPGWQRKTALILLGTAIVVGALSTVHKFNFGKEPSKMEVASEFLQFGKVGLIGEYWNSYIYACPDPDRIKATPHDKDNVRNHALVDSVFAQDRLFVIRDNWMDSFPDTLQQFGRTMLKKGGEFAMANSVACEYRIAPFQMDLPLSSFKTKPAAALNSGSIRFCADSIALHNTRVLWGPYLSLPKGHFSLFAEGTIGEGNYGDTIAILDVCTKFGKFVFTQQVLENEGEVAFTKQLRFASDSAIQNLEFRILYSGRADLQIDRVMLVEEK